jgi:integral membrane sensor domain MASE1
MNFIKNKILLHSLIIAISFFLANFILLQYGHFHEDAYILFIYVENMLNGNGITYYPSGEHTEGATDFLWMILLLLLAKIGFDVGTASILLNSFGVLLISSIILYEVSSIKKDTIYKKIAYLFLPLAWIPSLSDYLSRS